MTKVIQPPLDPCPLCGNPMYWCGSEPGCEDPHECCTQLRCTHCSYNVDFLLEEPDHDDEGEEAYVKALNEYRLRVATRWNRRP